jgi:integrase/recombinase XerD
MWPDFVPKSQTWKNMQRSIMPPKRLPEILTDREQMHLLSYLNNRLGSKEGVLFALLIRLMLNNGFRASEIINLRYQDVDWHTGNAWVREGKGKKDRAVRICLPDMRLLETWMYHHRYPGQTGPGQVPSMLWVFATINGNRLDDRWLRRVVKRECHRAGIDKDIHPHSLRHTFATAVYTETRDLAGLQMLLGHADIRTTMVYVHLNPASALQTTNELAVKRLSACSTI